MLFSSPTETVDNPPPLMAAALSMNPNKDHKPEKYDDLRLEFDPSIFSALEKHLPLRVLETVRDAKVEYTMEILGRYLLQRERSREILEYYHVPGQAVLHCGHHRHGARPTRHLGKESI